MAQKFDVVVIGGGPAGSAAARTLASLGRSVCVIDKSKFPRQKLCGGLVTTRAKTNFETVFERDWRSDLFVSSDSVWFFQGEKKLHDKPTPDRGPPLFFTMRFDFDSYLLGLAKEAGAVVFENLTVKGIDTRSKKVVAHNGNEIGYDFLIGCDGVNSIVAKTLFGTSFDQKTIGFGLEVEVPRDHLPNHNDIPEVDFGSANWGYGWTFPKAKSFTLGVGGVHRLNPNLKQRLSEYLSLSRNELDIADYKVRGHFIPFGDYREKPGNECVLLCGDAAGYVDPITGEGIGHAILSGYCAARAIEEALDEKHFDALPRYLELVKPITKSLHQANLFRWMIFPKPIQAPFAWAFTDAGTLRSGYLEILAGHHEYDHLYGLFLVQVRKAVKKLGRKLIGR
ncbi:NAD(P)/FAD-dependent oxidoreductase [Oricola nitratireducens]|uniref:NAD(P)/FAD-dependent oxidoreductase n=1 Tax=Oricola nitratireducens TaxID=2775868 RepID=UPI00186904CB|nr:geranylgeranyl reductase family protein [Oricola nitratireducens]